MYADTLKGMTSHIRDAVLKMDQLQSIWLGFYFFHPHTRTGIDIIYHLASLRTLKTMVVENGFNVQFPPSLSSVERPFSTLQDFTFVSALEEAPLFLSCLSSSDAVPENVTVYSTRLDYDSGLTTGSIGTILQSLSSSTSKPKLRHLTMRFTDPQLDMLQCSPHQIVIRAQAGSLLGLFITPSFALLRTLRIETHFVFHVDNAFLAALAFNLPSLVTLSIAPSILAEYKMVPRPQVCTLDGLFSLVTRCAHLSTLNIAVAAALQTDHLPGSLGESECLRDITLWTTPLEPNADPHVIAESFVAALPKLETCRVALPHYIDRRAIPDDARLEARQRWSSVLDTIRLELPFSNGCYNEPRSRYVHQNILQYLTDRGAHADVFDSWVVI